MRRNLIYTLFICIIQLTTNVADLYSKETATTTIKRQGESKTNAILYTQQRYGHETKYHLYDLKFDVKDLDRENVAKALFTEHGLNGIRFPIWGGNCKVSGCDTGHPSAGVIEEAVYERFVSRTLRALKYYETTGKDNFQVFLSLKSNKGAIPGWCFKGGKFDKKKLIPENYAQMVFDLIKYLKDKHNITVTVVGLDNESAFAQASKPETTWMYSETVAALRELISKSKYSAVRFISNEAWAPKPFNGGWYQKLMKEDPNSVDIYGVHYYAGKDHPKHFVNLEDEWDASNADKSREYWASEPHWTADKSAAERYEGDLFKVAEKTLCSIWAQSDLGLDAFCWWSYNVDKSLRSQLMKMISVPLLGSTPIRFYDHDDDGFSKEDEKKNYDDVTRDYDMDNNNLKTRAFINGNKVTLFIINTEWWSKRKNSVEYPGYSIGVEDAVISANGVLCKQWTGTELSAGDYKYQEFTIERGSDNHFVIDIPARAIISLQFEIAPKL